MTFMKKITINIKEFGPLKNQIIEFAPFLFFTGNSGLGKSYANYLIYFFMRSLSGEALEVILQNKVKKSSFTLSLKEIESYLNSHVEDFMRDFLGNQDLTCSVEYSLYDKKEEFDTSYAITIETEELKIEDTSHEHLKMFIVRIEKEVYRVLSVNEDVSDKTVRIAHFINRYVQKQLFDTIYARAVILPPARGAIVGENYSLKESVTSSCKMYDYFLRDYDLSQRVVRNNRRTNDEQTFFTNRVKELLHGDLVSEKGIQYLAINKTKRIPLTAAASSVKELSPFLFFLKNHADATFSFCIEEPEAHLHPTMQIDLADLIAACRNKGMMFQMTTHSDYFVQRINQLLQIGKLQKDNPSGFREFQSQNKWNRRFYLNEDDVVCYFFHEDENGNAVAEKLQIEDSVLPMKTFYKAITNLSEFEELLKD